MECHCDLFEFLGGVPYVMVPDNEKAGVRDACYYDPDINPTYADLATYYDVSVVPTRPGTPRDKGKVEKGERQMCRGKNHRDKDNLLNLIKPKSIKF